MSFCAGTALAFGATLLGACGDNTSSSPSADGGADVTFRPTHDSATTDKSSSVTDPCADGGPDPAVYDKTTADGGACNLRKTHGAGLARSCLPIAQGAYCDSLEFCIPATSAAEIERIAPDFDCKSTAHGCSGVRCFRKGGHTVDANVFAQMCAVTTSDVALLSDVLCWIYE
ncbi:hypothetical protein [Pendulispora albinea]|uniref:Secreted protein n=1 Tax=Pendulispora albinea TaxID=2741071 RepID=A0ABZ2LV47_9BACT